MSRLEEEERVPVPRLHKVGYRVAGPVVDRSFDRHVPMLGLGCL